MKRIALIFLLLIPLILNGCEQSVKEIDQKIVFICNYTCFSSYINEGYYIDYKGNKVFFDLTNESREYAHTDKLYAYLLETIDSNKSEPYLSENELKKCYNYLYSIDVDAEIEEEPYSVDYGEVTLYGVRLTEDQEPTFILIGGIGDLTLTNTDDDAGKIIEIFGDDVWKTK